MGRKIMYSVLSGALLAGAGIAQAQHPGQEEAATPPLLMLQEGVPGEGGPDGPFGPGFELLGFGGMHGGKVVKGAPFSATAVSEHTQTLADGNHITRKTQSNLFRDTQGRFRKEQTLPAFGAGAAGQAKSVVIISDPVAATGYMLEADKKIAFQMKKPAGHGPKGPDGAGGDRKAKFEAREQTEIADGTLKVETLGTQTIAGVVAQGTRRTRTIPAGRMGNDKVITVVSEQWYSNDLQLVVSSKHSDPRFGDSSYTLANIQRSEPAATLFTVPSDYTVQQGHGGRVGGKRFRRGPGMPAPAPPADAPAPPASN